MSLLAGLAFAVGMIITMINALRVGLLPRWMSFLGMFTALLILFPLGGAELQVVPAFWMVMMGILYNGKWPGGDPPAWESGEARPWPSRAQMQAARRGEVSAPGDVAPAASAPSGSSRRRRKRSGRN